MVGRFRVLVHAGDVAFLCHRISGPCRDRYLGRQYPCRLGFRDHQFCLVGRDRSRRHSHLGHPPAHAPGLAHLDQPVCRGHDALRRVLRRNLSFNSRGSALAGLLADPLSQHDADLAAVPQPARVGRVRCFDLRYRFADVLVRGAHSRSGDAARLGEEPDRPDHLRHPCHGIARLGKALAPLRTGLPASRGPGNPSGRVRAHGGQFRLRDLDHSRLARDDLSAILRCGRDLLRFCDGHDARHPAAQVLRPRRFHHHAPH